MRRLHERDARDQAWRTVAADENGEPIAAKGSLAQVRFPHRLWPIVLDQYAVSTGETTTTYTRLRTLLNERSEFRFAFYRESFMTRVGKFFGMRDVETGNPLLDRDYLVRTNDEAMIRALVMSSRIPELLVHQTSGKLELKKFRGRWRNRPENVAELSWHTVGVIQDARTLALLVQTLRETLDRLSSIGAAHETAVEYRI